MEYFNNTRLAIIDSKGQVFRDFLSQDEFLEHKEEVYYSFHGTSLEKFMDKFDKYFSFSNRHPDIMAQEVSQKKNVVVIKVQPIDEDLVILSIFLPLDFTQEQLGESVSYYKEITCGTDTLPKLEVMGVLLHGASFGEADYETMKNVTEKKLELALEEIHRRDMSEDMKVSR